MNLNLNLNEQDNSDNYLFKNEIKEEKDLSKENCMICFNQIQTPYKCFNCEYKVCENCYLEKMQNENYYYCENCGQGDFIKEENENKININSDYI